MSVGRQWQQRLDRWLTTMTDLCKNQIETVEFSGFETEGHLTYEEAVTKPRYEILTGQTWGHMAHYGWFFAEIILDDAYEGQWIELYIGLADEMLVYLNGEVIGSIDKHHRIIRLDRSYCKEQTYVIGVEAFAGNGPREEGGGPVPFGVEPFDYVTGHQVVVKESKVYLWHEDIYQGLMDYKVLYQLTQKLKEHDLRKQKILDGLKRFTMLVDLEEPIDKVKEAITLARDVLKPLLSVKNSETTPTMSVIGQSHLDLAWLWTEEETKRKSARTYGNQLQLMADYEDYQFLLCSPPIIEYIKEHYKDLYKHLKTKVDGGQMLPEGALWIEGDCNLPSGEALIRQFIYGKQWFKETFNIDSELAWMPDTFGFSGNLPQIMIGCGVKYFATQKLLRADPETTPFPYNFFWWEGIDGTRILSHIFKKNNAVLDPTQVMNRWQEDRNQIDDIDAMLFPFGYGDGGGGPTREMLEMFSRIQDLEGLPKCKMESPTALMHRIEEKGTANIYRGELYLPWHRGTYTSQAYMKLGQRKSELALRELEYWMGVFTIETGQMIEWILTLSRSLWKLLLFNTFHDILPGTSIKSVHDNAKIRYETIIKQANEALTALFEWRSGLDNDKKQEGLMIYNSLSFDRVYQGQKVPAAGCVLASQSANHKTIDHVQIRCQSGVYHLTNDFLEAVINIFGQVISLKRKGDSYEWIKSPSNIIQMYKDVPGYYDAWELDYFTKDIPVALVLNPIVEIIEEKYTAGIKIVLDINHSKWTQYITLDGKRLVFDTEVDWQEQHKLLKVDFNSNVYVYEAICGTQMGMQKRPTHRSTKWQQDRYEVVHHKYAAMDEQGRGLALLNDCKYGIGFEDSKMSLSLLKSSVYPDKEADKGLHHFSYALYPYEVEDGLVSVLQEAEAFNVPLRFSSTMITLSDFDFSLENLSNHVILETIKLSESNGRHVVMRFYEGIGRYARTSITIPRGKTIYATNMLEEPLVDNHHRDELKEGQFTFDIKPFEIRTFVLEI